MKKILFSIVMFCSLASFGQDVKATILTPEERDQVRALYTEKAKIDAEINKISATLNEKYKFWNGQFNQDYSVMVQGQIGIYSSGGGSTSYPCGASTFTAISPAFGSLTSNTGELSGSTGILNYVK